MKDFSHIIEFRHELHRHPELSGSEVKTARKVRSFIEGFHPDQIIPNLAGHGVAFLFSSEKKGPTVLLRCELDALPIRELNDMDYRSENEGVAHKCGHDGHMAIMAGVAEKIARERHASGQVILLFQPAEETGQGGKLVVNEMRFQTLKPDWVFALHNIPGYPVNSILIREGPFAAASVGLETALSGRTSHAGEPEKGINPANAVADIVKEILFIPQKRNIFSDLVLATIVHIELGRIAFGTSAGYAELRATLRAFNDDDLMKMQKLVSETILRLAMRDRLQPETRFVEYFPAVINNAEATGIIREAAMDHALPIEEIEKPFRWSEDFSNIINESKGAMFGLGSGTKTPELHSPEYDFPDQIIPAGVQMLSSIIYKILGRK